jgi:hypothetical protein
LASGPALEARGLSVRRGGREVLHDVAFRLPARRIVVVFLLLQKHIVREVTLSALK